MILFASLLKKRDNFKGRMAIIVIVLTCVFPATNGHAQDGNHIANNGGGRCLDADTATIKNNGTKIQLYDCWSGKNQQWRYNSIDGNILNVQSGRCLDADTATIGQNGTKVQLYDCWGGNNQRWHFNEDGTITNVQSGRCLDADMATIKRNGTKIQLYDCWRGKNQNWLLLTASLRISATETQIGPDICVKGEGFRPGSTAKIRYINIPKRTAPLVGSSGRVSSDGSFSIFDTTQRGGLGGCNDDQIHSKVTINVIQEDSNGNLIAKASGEISGSYWCANALVSTNFNGGCP